MPKLSEVDEVLIRYADQLSPEAISAKIDGYLSPSAVRNRITQLVTAPDWLSNAQRSQLITLKMQQIINELSDQTLTARNAEVILNGLSKISDKLEARIQTTEADLTTLYAFQGTVLLDAINVALIHLRGALTQGDPENEAIFDNQLESALRFAQMEIGKHELTPDTQKELGA